MITEFNSQVIEKNKLTESIYELKFSKPKNFSFKNGQFIKITFNKEKHNTNHEYYKNSENIIRFYSIDSSPKEDFIRLIIKTYDNGFASEIFKNSNINDEFKITGPYGTMTIKDDEYKTSEKTNKINSDFSYVFIAAGVGIVPFHNIIIDYVNSKNIRLYYSVKNRSELLFDEEFSEFEKKYSNFEYIPIITREGKKLHFQDVFTEKDIKNSNELFYICGVKSFVMSIKEYLESKMVDSSRIIIELYN